MVAGSRGAAVLSVPSSVARGDTTGLAGGKVPVAEMDSRPFTRGR